MTPEMLDEIEDGLIERTNGFCFRIEQDADGGGDAPVGQRAFGAVIVDGRGQALTIECAIGDDGTAQVVARKWVDGEPADPIVLAVPGSVFVST
jgi:hypothetical protein